MCPCPLDSRTVRHLRQVHTRPAHAAIRGAACKLWVLSAQIRAHIPVTVALRVRYASIKRYFISLFSRCFLSVVRKSLCGWPALAARYLYDLQRERHPIIQEILLSLFQTKLLSLCHILVFGQNVNTEPSSVSTTVVNQRGASWCKLMDHISFSGLCFSLNVVNPSIPGFLTSFLVCYM